MENFLEEINIGISMADSSLISCFFETDKNYFEVKIRRWNNDIVVFVFHTVLTFRYNGGDELVGLFINKNNTELMCNFLNKAFIKLPDINPYKHFQFIDIDDESYLDIISENVTFKIIPS